MFFILNLMLIISINKTYGYIIQNKEIILLPAWNPAGAEEMLLTFKVFGKLVQLNMHRNDQIVSPGFEKLKNKTKGVTEKMSELETSNSCFHIYEDYFRSAAFNICQEHGLEGFVFLENDTLEIWPLQNVIKQSLSFIDDFCVKEQINFSFGRPHLVKRSQYLADSDFYQLHKITSKRSYKETLIKQERFTIKLAVFINPKAYNLLMEIEQLTNIDHITVMMEYLNQMQNLFHHPSLGVKIDISLVRLDFMKEQPPIYTDNSTATLHSFCKYTRDLNPLSDDDPRHWDISLYIMGEDVFESKYTFNFLGISIPLSNSHVFGSAFLNTVCNPDYSCAIVTLSSTEFYNVFNRLHSFKQLNFRKAAYQSFTTAVHEIGHVLGLRHISTEECATYVMCQGRKSYAEGLEWSTFSRDTIKSTLEQKLCLLHTNTQNIDYDDHYWAINASEDSICENYPGREQTAKAQCESFLQDDEDANVIMSYDICKSLHCETPHENTVYFAGRALNGTPCALGKECCNGQCVPVIEPPYNFKHCQNDNWSEWKKDSCKSSCLMKSKGTLIKRRSCQHRRHRTASCIGLYYDVDLCDDSSFCTDTRTTIAEFTIKKCIEYMKFAKQANIEVELLIAPGLQMHHDVKEPWIACTIFCRQKKKPNWYALRQDFLNSGDRYFPDGTWCHNDNVQDYYCRQHHCLPENYSFVYSDKSKNNCLNY